MNKLMTEEEIEKTNTKAIGIAALTVILNGLIGLFLAPFSILLTPVVLIITTSFVCIGTKNIKVIFISALTYLFVALNDISIKLYSGGTHDHEGSGWVHAFLFMGLAPTFLILLGSVLSRKGESLMNKVIAVVLFVGLMAVHLHLFSNLGIGRHY